MLRTAIVLYLSLLPLVAGQDGRTLDELVHQLGDDDFRLREQASNELLRRVEHNPKFANQLKRFADDDDPEIRFRIAELTKNLPVILAWVDPSEEKAMKSGRGLSRSMQLTVKNRSKIEIKTHWLDWQGDRQARRSVKPGKQVVYTRTFEGHPWLITDTMGNALGVYVPKGSKDVQIIFTGKEKP